MNRGAFCAANRAIEAAAVLQNAFRGRGAPAPAIYFGTTADNGEVKRACASTARWLGRPRPTFLSGKPSWKARTRLQRSSVLSRKTPRATSSHDRTSSTCASEPRTNFQRIRNSYIDDDLYRRYSIVDEPTGPSICRSCRPHSTWNRGASGSRRGIRIRVGRPLLVDATYDLVAPEGVGIGGADFA